MTGVASPGAEGRSTLRGGSGRLALPNGLEVAYQTRAEAEFLYQDIFEKRVYCQHGVSLQGARCVFDVGANVGLFTLFVHRECPAAQVFAFEPAPPLFALLAQNAAGAGAGARLFPYGLADRAGQRQLTFYPNSSGMSSFHADPAEERQVLQAILENQLREGREGMAGLMRHAEDLLDERLRSRSFPCEVRTLSQVIREHGVERIDLLKVDVQKCELEVLEGIAPEDWPRLRQIVVEVHDLDGRLQRVLGLLAEHGFAATADQDPLYEASIMFNVYAVRRERSPTPRLPTVRRREERLRRALQAQRGQGRGSP
jgi:FkbM family methyltransferase